MLPFLSIYEDLREASTLDDLWHRMRSLQDNFGITSAQYGTIYCESSTKNQQSIHPSVALGDHPQEFIDYLGEETFVNHDMTSQHCITKTTPFIWHEFEKYAEPTDMQRHFMTSGAREFNMEFGVTIPVRFNNYGVGGMGMATQNLDQREFNKVWASHQNEIITITHVFDELTRAKFINQVFNLSIREKDILTWLSNGSSIQEIAYKLKRKPSTIETQLGSARQKLDAKSNVQAVTKALLLNVINP